ncbi:MAG: type II secretion system protein [bacterium]|nr:type II secretion system protein [bacterium]
MQNTNRGFTLIEMIMSVAVFTVVALIAAGALLAIADANRKAQAFKSVVNNINFALESVARNLRTGSGYSLAGFARGNCLSGYTNGISFTSQDGTAISYYLSGTQIVRTVGSGKPIGVTAPEVRIDRFCFLLGGTQFGDEEQPHALMLVGGIMKEGKKKLESRFDIQTFITQRLMDS